MNFKILTILILLVTHARFSVAGLHDNWTDNDGVKTCMFQSSIEKSDLAAFRKNLESGCSNLILSSNGGDVETAIAMGKLIRNRKIYVSTWSKGSCASACVFLYAGGVERVPYGKVLIHRPYFSSVSGLPYDVTQKKYRDLESLVKNYLRQMNVSEVLFDRMMLIQPEDAEPLTMAEMESMGMGLRDPVYTEYMDNKRAVAWKIEKKDWLSKKKLTKSKCGDIDGIIPEGDNGAIFNCWRAIFPEYLNMPK